MASNRGRWLRTAGLAVFMISLAFPVTANVHAHHSRAELRRLLREASTAEQFRTLAMWFREEEAVFRDKTEAENRDFEKLRRMTVPAKFPTPADSARSLRDYYAYEAHRKAEAAVRCEVQLSRMDPSFRPPFHFRMRQRRNESRQNLRYSLRVRSCCSIESKFWSRKLSDCVRNNVPSNRLSRCQPPYRRERFDATRAPRFRPERG